MVDLKPISDFVIDELRKTLAVQGHNLTGKLANSIEAYTLDVLNGYLIRFYWEDYGVPLDTGVPAANIKFSPGSGAKSSKYIDGLVKYVKQRMNVSGDKEALGIAFAIAYKQKKEGMSTIESKRFSSSGKRNNWVNNTLEEIDSKLTVMINDALAVILDDMIFNAVKVYGTNK
jgi:hypothetical protein